MTIHAGDLMRAKATPMSARAWYFLAVLTTLLIVSFIDRGALNVLAGPVKADLELTDVQVSLLIGLAFSALYGLAGVPAGYLVDRFSRRGLVFAGALVWMAMTAACGLAQSFGALFVGRTGVGLGEAILSPAAYSMIRDGFPSEQRARAFGVYNMGVALGAGASLFIVGGLSAWIGQGHLVGLPLVGDLKSWQAVFAVIGVAGLPLALLLLTIREPDRSNAHLAEGGATVRAAFAHVVGKRGIYLPLLLSQAFYGLSFFGTAAWLPTAISRVWSVSPAQVGISLGPIQLVATPLGLLVCGFVLDRLTKRGWADATPLIGCIAQLGAGLAIFVAPIAPSMPDMWLALGVQAFLTPWAGIVGATVMAQVTPGRMMGKISAFSFLALSMVGMGLGPTLIAALAQNLFSGADSLAHAVGLGASVTMAASALLLVGIWWNRNLLR